MLADFANSVYNCDTSVRQNIVIWQILNPRKCHLTNSHIWWKSHFWPVNFFCDSGRNMKWRCPQINDFCNKLYLLAENQLYELWTHRMGWWGWGLRSSQKNIFTYKQWFFIILENTKRYHKTSHQLGTNIFLTTFWCKV